YQVLKVDMEVTADPADIDMSEADEGVTLLNTNEKQTNSSTVRSDEKGVDIIDEDIDLSRAVEFALDYKTTHFKAGGKLTLNETIEVEIQYDFKLFGKDYLYCKMESDTKGSFSMEFKAKVDNDESVKDKTDEAEIKLGKIPFPLGAGFSCSVSLTLPIEISLEGGATMEASYSVKAGFIYSTTDGKQDISKKSFNVTFIQAEAKFEVKAGPRLTSSIEFMKDVLKGEISSQIGGDFTATAKTGSVGITDAESIHGCALCVDGDVYLFANAKAKLSYTITDHLKGTPFSVTIFEVKRYLSEFYVSVINEKDSPLGGKVSFGLGSCPNQKYRTKFVVKDTGDNEVSGVDIFVGSSDKDYGIVQSGKTMYLYNGDYTADSRVNNKQLSKDFTVKGKASTVTLSEKTDVKPDLDDPGIPEIDPADIVANGTCGENLTWILDKTGILYIIGTGRMDEWNNLADVPWDKFRTQIKKIIICNGVEAISTGSFYDCSSLTGVTIPASMTGNIDAYMFRGCVKLNEIQISGKNPVYSSVDGVLFNKQRKMLVCYPAGKTEAVYTVPGDVTEIGQYAFYNGINLTDITLPSGVTDINSCAFSGCINLTDVNIPNTVTWMGHYVFAECSKLASITIPDSVTEIGNHVFEQCDSLTSITIPDSVTEVGSYVFWNCKGLKSATIGNGLKSTNAGLFSGCENLRNVTIGNRVEQISQYAFFNCTSLTSVTIPVSVTYIGDGAFGKCSSLSDVYYQGSQVQWAAITIHPGSTTASRNDPLQNAAIHYNS
ncbi:MAG: leucine-rich repeat domain-containing protein, partial [Clostridia bacterium]|nr:leucine-rich repeat domain-containing protein [Clostridia bacterium]